ncbi:MAG: Ku protein [Negativicutes bacterium]|nr:Ku protein [Negativicutes bacterium]
MQRSLWKGQVSFGLVNIPVKLFNAVRKKTINFHQLRASDGCRVRLKKVCVTDGTEVSGENMVKGFETAADRYVLIPDEELQALYPKASRSIEIQDFVEPGQLDSGYFDQPYYLVPDTGAAKTYALLLAALRESGKVAIARLVMRNKEYLATLRPAGRLIGLSTMFYADELVAAKELAELPPDEPELTTRELTMAEQLIESLAADFTPQKYHNEYHQRVMDMIERKAAGQEVAVSARTADKARVIDLTAALEASLAAVKKPAAAARRKKASAQ